jgi:hypothetical protein
VGDKLRALSFSPIDTDGFTIAQSHIIKLSADHRRHAQITLTKKTFNKLAMIEIALTKITLNKMASFKCNLFEL